MSAESMGGSTAAGYFLEPPDVPCPASEPQQSNLLFLTFRRRKPCRELCRVVVNIATECGRQVLGRTASVSPAFDPLAEGMVEFSPYPGAAADSRRFGLRLRKAGETPALRGRGRPREMSKLRAVA